MPSLLQLISTHRWGCYKKYLLFSYKACMHSSPTSRERLWPCSALRLWPWPRPTPALHQWRILRWFLTAPRYTADKSASWLLLNVITKRILTTTYFYQQHKQITKQHIMLGAKVKVSTLRTTNGGRSSSLPVASYRSRASRRRRSDGMSPWRDWGAGDVERITDDTVGTVYPFLMRPAGELGLEHMTKYLKE